ncbi:ATPase AAA [Alphaproteobacteria bacterium]|nr:ATPase AAA [Alphaproteobacteria bacterium]
MAKIVDYFIRSVSIKRQEIEEDSYINSIPAIKSIRKLALDNSLTFFVGENGSGKSTLLEAIAVAYGFNPEGGSKNFNFCTRATHSDLGKAIAIVKGVKSPKDGFFFRAESFYNVASEVDNLGISLKSYGGKSLHDQSHGESFFSLIQNRFGGNGLYILDEPEAALSPQRLLSLIVIISRLIKQNSQFIIATHSPILLGISGANILSFDDGKIRKTKYEDTECYQITKMFINNREQILEKLLNDDNG